MGDGLQSKLRSKVSGANPSDPNPAPTKNPRGNGVPQPMDLDSKTAGSVDASLGELTGNGSYKPEQHRMALSGADGQDQSSLYHTADQNVVSVFFETNSAELDEQDEVVLSELVTKMGPRLARVARVEFEGFADLRGSEEDNHALGQRRASGVAGYVRRALMDDFYQSFSIYAPDFSVKSHGENARAIDLRDARRVDINLNPSLDEIDQRNHEQQTNDQHYQFGNTRRDWKEMKRLLVQADERGLDTRVVQKFEFGGDIIACDEPLGDVAEPEIPVMVHLATERGSGWLDLRDANFRNDFAAITREWEGQDQSDLQGQTENTLDLDAQSAATIQFPSGSAALEGEDAVTLQHVAGMLRNGLAELRQISIWGDADDHDDNAANLELAQSRAEAVAAYLKVQLAQTGASDVDIVAHRWVGTEAGAQGDQRRAVVEVDPPLLNSSTISVREQQRYGFSKLNWGDVQYRIESLRKDYGVQVIEMETFEAGGEELPRVIRMPNLPKGSEIDPQNPSWLTLDLVDLADRQLFYNLFQFAKQNMERKELALDPALAELHIQYLQKYMDDESGGVGRELAKEMIQKVVSLDEAKLNWHENNATYFDASAVRGLYNLKTTSVTFSLAESSMSNLVYDLKADLYSHANEPLSTPGAYATFARFLDNKAEVVMAGLEKYNRLAATRVGTGDANQLGYICRIIEQRHGNPEHIYSVLDLKFGRSGAETIAAPLLRMFVGL